MDIIDNSKEHPNWNSKTTKWFILLLLICSILRVVIIVISDPVLSANTDSAAYVKLAENIRNVDLSQDTGARTPGYPIFIILMGGICRNIQLSQMFLGVIITAMLFMLSWEICHNIKTSLIIGAGYGLILAQISYENNV